jgi:hypothetical protein
VGVGRKQWVHRYGRFSSIDALRRLGWLLRAQHDGLLRDPPPEHWIELP